MGSKTQNSGRRPMSRYLLYAIGEIGLVVLGILIAVQINSWNTHRIERQQESQILQDLKLEYLDNKEQLQSKIFVRNVMNNSAVTMIGFYDLGPEQLNIDSLDFHLANTIFRPTFDPALGVTDELLSSGKLYLIRNRELRKLLTNWSGKYYNELKEEEQAVASFVLENYVPFLIANFQLRNTFTNASVNDLWEVVHLEKGRELPTLIGPSENPDDGSQLISHPDFEDHLINMIMLNTSTNYQSYGVLTKIEEILVLIEKELGS